MIPHIFISIVFLVFAVTEWWNNPDPYLWVLLYLAVAAIPLFYIKKNINTFILGAGLFLLFLVTMTYLPALSDWLSEGPPNHTKHMQAESPHLGLIRKLFGLVLCFITVGGYYLSSKRQEKIN